jgi:DNA-binding Lrp family transcriptional regulator
MKKALKNVELKLVSELMKNSRRSDRELARIIGVSQPTITRLRNILEKRGAIVEYTMIPDFSQLGYRLMGVTFARIKDQLTKEEETELKKTVSQTEQQNPYASLLAVNGLGMQKDRMFITLYKDYADYARAMQLVKQLPYVNVENMETFLVDLEDTGNYRILTMSQVARHILSSEENSEP